MTNHQIPKCPWCGAEGNSTDCFGCPCTFDHPTSYIDWECKSSQQWGHNAEQSPKCKDRVIAQQAAEISEKNTEIQRLTLHTSALVTQTAVTWRQHLAKLAGRATTIRRLLAENSDLRTTTRRPGAGRGCMGDKGD